MREVGRDWQGAVAWAREVCMNPRTVFLDTETTGLGTTAEIIEIALLGGDGRVLFDSLVRPRGVIPADATAIHHITAAMISGAPTWGEVATSVHTLLANRVVVVYNADFDRRMARQEWARLGWREPEAEWHCAMRAYAAFHAGPAGPRGGAGWRSLTAATVALGVPTGGHRAVADARACRSVVQAMAACTNEQ